MPLYSVMALALAESFDEEDDEDVRKLMGLDPRVAYDSDIMFRAWIMDKFGEPVVGDVSMADILIHGPLGALSNTELSSRTSLDLKNMWFREAVTGDSTSDTIIKTALANIAGGQMLIQALNAKDNFADGDMYGAMKKMAPAFIRSWVAAEQGEAEGIVSGKGDTIIAKDDISALDTLRTISGFRPMRLARWQDYYITRGKNEKKIEAEKTQLLSTLDRKIQEGEISSMEQLKEFVADEIVPFNRTYPDPSFIITEETIMRSLKGRAEVGRALCRACGLRRRPQRRTSVWQKSSAHKKPPPGRSASGGSINQTEGASSSVIHSHIRQMRKPLIPDLVSTTLLYTTFSFSLRSTGRISRLAALGSRHGKKSDAPLVKARQFIS